MNNKFSDEQIDQILQKLVNDSALSEDMIDEIAESPYLWRNIKNNIDEKRSTEKPSWFFVWSWQFTAFGLLICGVCIGLFLIFNLSRNDEFAQKDKIENSSASVKDVPNEIGQNSVPQKSQTKIKEENPLNISPKIVSSEKIQTKSVASRKDLKPNRVKSTNNDLNISQILAKSSRKTAEVKTDFIALSSSPTPESGHILKVKVPRSMMVSLGVANDVENNSELVNAEIVVGDDGLTHAIRFVR